MTEKYKELTKLVELNAIKALQIWLYKNYSESNLNDVILTIDTYLIELEGKK